MDLRRVLVIGGLGVGLVLAGCGGSGGSGTAAGGTAPAPTPSASATAGATPAAATPSGSASGAAAPSAQAAGNARAALATAARKLAEDSVRMTMDMGTLLKASGVADPATGAMQMRMQVGGAQSMTLDMRNTGKDLYLRFGGQLGKSLGDQWLHVESSRLPGNFGVGSAQDPGDAQRLLRSVTQVRQDGPGRFTGTLDATKSPSANPRSVQALGAKAKAVPFTAEVDAEGRLIGLTLQMDAVQPGLPAMKARYSDFGTPVAVSKPAGRIVKAPQEMIDAMNR